MEDKKLLISILNVGRLMKKEIHKNKCLASFSHAEIEVLNFLKNTKDSTMKSVADYLHIKPPSVTPIIDNLAKNGSIKKVQNSKDRRETYLRITRKGTNLLQKKQKKVHEAVKKIFSSINNADKIKLIKILDKIWKN